MPPKKCNQIKAKNRREPHEPSAPESAADPAVDSVDSKVSNVSSQIKKRKTTIATLSEAEEETMLAWLREHPELYNKKVKEYKNLRRKEALWQEKAAEMGRSVEHLQTWYRSMRTRMARLLKNKSSGEFTDRDAWVMENLAFLRKHIEAVHRGQGQLKRMAQGPGAPSASQSTLDPVTNHIMIMQQQLIDRLQPQGDAERLGFSEWVRATLVSLQHDVWRRAQRDIIDVLHRAIRENDAEQQSDNGSAKSSLCPALPPTTTTTTTSCTGSTVPPPPPANPGPSFDRYNRLPSSQQMWQTPPNQWPGHVQNSSSSFT
ncbi:Hypp2110 [Branchiostoma lanceolatum]|uniref:Hypp2110 protein n=1 Tax=Branchiostoma lanceolatum TaxID=7740 RepID=A0A8J9ZQB1_BRALA|nr:Hypp2110 [Branchiostoma lanceolatum]